MKGQRGPRVYSPESGCSVAVAAFLPETPSSHGGPLPRLQHAQILETAPVFVPSGRGWPQRLLGAHQRLWVPASAHACVAFPRKPSAPAFGPRVLLFLPELPEPALSALHLLPVLTLGWC